MKTWPNKEQNTILKQLSKISPKWANELQKDKESGEYCMYFKSGRKEYDISNAKTCIVGEAHGRRETYSNDTSKKYCDECVTMSIKIMRITYPNKRSMAIGFKEAAKFIQHWNKKHKNGGKK